MTQQLVTQGQELTRQQRPATAAGGVAKTLRSIQENYIAPFDKLEAMDRKYPKWPSLAFRYGPGRVDGLIWSLSLEDPRGEAEVAAFYQASNDLPPQKTMLEVQEAMRPVWETKAKPTAIRSLIGLMVDSYPNASPHSPEVYLETLVHESEVSSISAHLIARTCREIVRTYKFPPTVSEFVTAMDNFRSPPERLANAIAARENMDAIYAEMLTRFGEDPERPGEPLWPYKARLVARPRPA